MDYAELGKRIRHYRRQRRMTQEQLASSIGLCTSFIGHIERGSRKASLETVVELCRVLHVSPNDLLDAECNTLPESLAPETRRQIALVVHYASEVVKESLPQG